VLCPNAGWNSLPEKLRKLEAAENWVRHSTGTSTELLRYLQQKRNRASKSPPAPLLESTSAGKPAKIAPPPFCVGKSSHGVLHKYMSLDDTGRFDALKEKRRVEGKQMASVADMEKTLNALEKVLKQERVAIEKKERKIIRHRSKKEETTVEHRVMSNQLFETHDDLHSVAARFGAMEPPSVPYKDLPLVAAQDEFSPYGHVNHIMHKLRLSESLLVVPAELEKMKEARAKRLKFRALHAPADESSL
jgi:hypothetical protein